MPLSLAVSAVTTIGYLGVLAGPALMGFVAHATSLVIVFCITLALMCFVAVVSRAVQLDGREPVFSESKENVRGERFQHTVIM